MIANYSIDSLPQVVTLHTKNLGMSHNSSDIQLARQRIAAAYDTQVFQKSGEKLVELLTTHLQRVQKSEGPVLNWEEPVQNTQLASSFLGNEFPVGAGQNDNLEFSEQTKSEIANHFAELVDNILSRGHNLHDPRYIGHQVPASMPMAALFDAVGAVTNQVMAIYEMGPWAGAVEMAMVDALAEKIGWPADSFSGVVTHGGSLANLTALLTARNVVLANSWETGIPHSGPAPVLVAHAEAHYCIARSAGIIGLGTENVIPARLDDRRRIDPRLLDQTLSELKDKGHPIVAVAASACATPIGAFDPLHEIADVCEKHSVWMHVDAAHGGAALMSRKHRRLLEGIERADSLIWDAHKMLFVPALCAFVFFRDKEHRFEAFRQNAPYLFDPSAPGLAEFDSGLKTIECTKRAAAFGLWGVWSLFGSQIFEDMVDVTFDMGRQLYEKLLAADDFEPLNDPECNIVTFRYLPEPILGLSDEEQGDFQLKLRRSIIQSGDFYLVPTRKDGIGALRVTVMNPLTTVNHLDELMTVLREHGQQLLSES